MLCWKTHVRLGKEIIPRSLFAAFVRSGKGAASIGARNPRIALLSLLLQWWHLSIDETKRVAVIVDVVHVGVVAGTSIIGDAIRLDIIIISDDVR